MSFLNNLATKKWFVPVLISVFVLMILPSFFKIQQEENSEPATTERQLEEMCNAIDGVTNTKVMITYGNESVSVFSANEKRIMGIAVACNGGDNPNNQLKIYNMIKALFEIPSTRITVTERSD